MKLNKIIIILFLIFLISNLKVQAAAVFINSWVTDSHVHSTSDFTIAQSITPTSGNLLLLFITTRQDLASTPTISGWNNRGISCSPTTTACIYSYSKIASGSETISVTLDNQDNPNSATLSILEYSGAINTLNNSVNSSGNSNTVTTGTIATSRTNVLLIGVAATDANVSHGNWTNNFIQRVDHRVTGKDLELNVAAVDLTSNTPNTYSTGTTIGKSQVWSTRFLEFETVESSSSDLILSKSVTNTNPAVNQNFTFNLSLFNSGARNNTNVKVFDSIPSGLVLVSTTPSLGTTYNLNTGIWDIGTIYTGATKTLSMIFYPSPQSSGQTIVNNSSLSSYDITDPNTSNNTASVSIYVKPISSAPYINSPLISGDTTVSGATTGADGTEINVYNGSTLIGTTTSAGGTWAANVVTLSGGQSIKAKAIFPGGSESEFSTTVTVLYKSAIPLITVPITAGDTEISGTTSEGSGTQIEVFLDSALLGSTTTGSSNWTLSVPKSTLISGHLIKVRATATGKAVSGFSDNITVIDRISPVPAITNTLVAGDTVVEGTSLGEDGTYIEIFKTRGGVTTSIGFSVVSDNTWFISGLDSLEIRSGDIFTAKARIDTNNDGVNDSSDIYSTSSTQVTAIQKISQVPSINYANAGATLISGSSTGNNLTLIKVYKNNSLLNSTTVVNNLWSLATSALLFGDEYKATATFDNNNDGVVDGSDSASGYSSIMTVGGSQPTNAPILTEPITAGDTTIEGESYEADGTIIEVFVNGVSVGTVVKNYHHWILTTASNTLQSGEIVSAKATASGKTQSAFSAEVTVIDKIPPTPSVLALKAGDTEIQGEVLAPDGSIVDVLVNDIQIGSAPVSSNNWSLNVSSTELQTGEVVKARTHIDSNNDRNVELDDVKSSLSSGITVIDRISPVPILDPIGFNTRVITGSLSPVAITKIYVYRLRNGVRTLLGTTQTNSPSFFLNEIISNPWELGDSITATSITDTNNDGIVDSSDIQSIDSDPQVIYDDSVYRVSSTSNEPDNKSCSKDKPNGSPTIYRIEPIGNNKLKVYFNPLNNPRNKFEYEYVNIQSTFKHLEDIKNFNSGSFEIKNLFMGNKYKIRIRAVNGCKKGDWSDFKLAQVNFTTTPKFTSKSTAAEVYKKPYESEIFPKLDFKTSPSSEINTKPTQSASNTNTKNEPNNFFYFLVGFLMIGGFSYFIYKKYFE